MRTDYFVKPPTDQVIPSFAILTVNWEQDRTNDYLRPFSEMLAEVVTRNPNQILLVDQLQAQFRDLFGLKLPAGVIESLLRRLVSLKYVRKENGCFVPNRARLDKRDFVEAERKVLRDYSALIDKLVDFLESEFGMSVDQAEAETLLESFLADHYDELLHAMVYGSQPIVDLKSTGNPKHKYLTGNFITRIAKAGTKEIEYLESVLKGMMLANVLYLPGSQQVKKRWTTAIYFDTRFLVEALGYQGEVKRDMRIELLNSLRKTGARLRCFRHNLNEVINILHAGLRILEKGDFSSVYGPMIATIDYLLEKGVSTSELSLELARTEEYLLRLGIEVLDKPEYVFPLGIDEAKFDDLLVNSRTINDNANREEQRKNDIDSVASVYRLRKGMSFRRIEDCKAIFVTSNVRLLKAAHRILKERNGEVTHCITSYTLSNLLWLLRPDVLPDLPRKQIIAYAYAAMQPDHGLWSKYITTMTDLKNRREIDHEDFYVYRYTQEARASLMEVTQGSGESFTEGTVREVVNAVRAKMQADAIEESVRKQAALQRIADERTEELSKQLDESAVDRKRLIEKEARIVARRHERARAWSSSVFRMLRYLLILLYLIGWLLTSHLHLFAFVDNSQLTVAQGVAGVGSIVFGAFFVAQLNDGKGIRRRLDDAERRFAAVVEKGLTGLSGE